MATRDSADAVSLQRYRPWLYAAAVYNLLWGAMTVLFPELFFRLVGMPPPSYLPLWQVVGMFVLVFAPGYWWAARYPDRHAHLVLIGLFGKTLGPLGCLWAVASGQLPAVFGWTIVTNDLIWLPAFWLYLRAAARRAGGWSGLLSGRTAASAGGDDRDRTRTSTDWHGPGAGGVAAGG